MESLVDYSERVARFKARILPAESVLIVTHDYPDPDCLASAVGIAHLLTFWGAGSCKTAYGGFVGRAENRAMVRLLEMSAVPLALADLSLFDRIVVVDSVPWGGNVSLPKGTPVDAVFDHHLDEPLESAPFFFDVRKDVGATSTIVTQYLLNAGCPIPTREATALFYGIKTDTGDMGREASPEDLYCYKRLFELLDHRLLAKIEHPERDTAFFHVVDRATRSMSVSGNVGFVYVGEVVTPDYVGEMADFFHRLKDIEWTVCGGVFQERLYFSIRAKKEMDAGLKARKIAENCGGSGGGHGKIGAGQISLAKKGTKDAPGRLKKAVKNILGVAGKSEIPLLKMDSRD